MNRNSLLLRLVLLVSFSHATVHLLEQSIASVELDVSSEFQLNSEQSGLLSTSFRIPYGFGALLAGMLADRIGARRILAIYLGASACICLAVMLSPSSTMLYISLFCLGCFASIYHPAGLALLANSTTPYERPRALGLHGVLGSTGIMSAPLIAGLTLSVSGATWKTFYAVIAVCCAILTWMLLTMLKPVPPEQVAQPEGGHNGNKSETETNTVKLPAMPVPLDRLQKRPFALMVTSAALCGIVYGGFLHFLTRYLTEVPQVERLAASFGFTGTASARFCSALALSCGAAGQFLAGRMAHPRHLRFMLAAVYAANIPFLLWMSVAQGLERLVAACLLAFVHFMNQPLYNSLLPEFVPPGKRSTWYGFSAMMGFGLGAVGPWFVGTFDNYRDSYSWLAGIALLAAIFPLLLPRPAIET